MKRKKTMTTIIFTIVFLITLHDGLQLINMLWIPVIIIAFFIDKNDDGKDTEFYTGY